MRSLKFRKGRTYLLRKRNIEAKRELLDRNNQTILDYLQSKVLAGVNLYIDGKMRVRLTLPKVMNLSSEYENTVNHMLLLRKIAEYNKKGNNSVKLAGVDFNELTNISTSAALLLTAELSRWDDSNRSRIVPKIETWQPNIIIKFWELGFFELFQNIKPSEHGITAKPKIRLVKYIKGRIKENDYRRLKSNLRELIGADIDQWMFLHSGLDEAITNVTHHAYPSNCKIEERDQNWYLTGAFNTDTKELKVVFLDQGIGIPNSLPASKMYEKVLDWLKKFPISERKLHKKLLEAAVSVERTQTAEEDRGNGIPDMLEFIKQRKEGYISIFSQHGLFKLTIDAVTGKEVIKTESFKAPICGTLIIWKVQL